MNQLIVIFIFIGCFFSQIGRETVLLLHDLHAPVSQSVEGSLSNSEQPGQEEYEAVQAKQELKFSLLKRDVSIITNVLKPFFNYPFSSYHNAGIPLYLLYRSILI